MTYLHEQTPPIVHRDIKPENILVQSRDPFQVKFGDFGLSKASDDLVTLCGTPTYLAPELAKYCGSLSTLSPKYTHAIDVWSLGVVVFQYFHGLPHPGSGAGLSWCEKIVKRFNNREPDDLIDILSSMVVIEPQSRKSSRQCLERALELDYPRPLTPKLRCFESFPPLPSRTGSATPTEKLSTHEIDELRGRVNPAVARTSSRITVRAVDQNHNFSKRQRSLHGNRRRTKSFLRTDSVSSGPVPSGTYNNVLNLLMEIQNKNSNGSVDTLTAALVDELCCQLQRLGIGEIKAHHDHVTQGTDIVAVVRSRERTIARFTLSDLAQPVAHLAQYLTQILELLSTESAATSSLDNRKRSRRAKNSINQIVFVKSTSRDRNTRTPPKATAQPRTSESMDHTRSVLVDSDSTYPVTFPSDLLDATNVSGCVLSTPM